MLLHVGVRQHCGEVKEGDALGHACCGKNRPVAIKLNAGQYGGWLAHARSWQLRHNL